MIRLIILTTLLSFVFLFRQPKDNDIPFIECREPNTTIIAYIPLYDELNHVIGSVKSDRIIDFDKDISTFYCVDIDYKGSTIKGEVCVLKKKSNSAEFIHGFCLIKQNQKMTCSYGILDIKTGNFKKLKNVKLYDTKRNI